MGYSMDEIAKALQIAVEAHKGAVDKGGNDYIFHPISVALHMKTNEEKIVALLHDIVEDTEITIEDLRKQGFSEKILMAIDAITRRENEDRETYLCRVKANSLAKAVKIADLNHNSDITRIIEPKEKDFERIKKYVKEIKFWE